MWHVFIPYSRLVDLGFHRASAAIYFSITQHFIRIHIRNFSGGCVFPIISLYWFHLSELIMPDNEHLKPEVGDQMDTSSPTSTHQSSDMWWSLVHWKDLPHWQQDNHHIHASYRRASYSYARSWQSIFHWHNESVNIWSHLIPGALALPFSIVLYKTLEPRYEQASAADVIALGCFFIGIALCLGMSATFHTVSNHSPAVARMWNQLDYAGISLLIAGSFIPSVYYGFWCNPDRQWVYWTMVSQTSPSANNSSLTMARSAL